MNYEMIIGHLFWFFFVLRCVRVSRRSCLLWVLRGIWFSLGILIKSFNLFYFATHFPGKGHLVFSFLVFLLYFQMQIQLILVSHMVSKNETCWNLKPFSVLGFDLTVLSSLFLVLLQVSWVIWLLNSRNLCFLSFL